MQTFAVGVQDASEPDNTRVFGLNSVMTLGDVIQGLVGGRRRSLGVSRSLGAAVGTGPPVAAGGKGNEMGPVSLPY